MELASNNTTSLEPFLKWAGGKRWLVRRETQIFPPSYSRYIEPFVGGAAVFFSQANKPFIIADSNEELINCYKAIQTNWKDVEKHLQFHQQRHSDEYYYKVRESQPRLNYTRAAKFIYLNRTCWNGLFRVNLEGKFNVPRGTKDKVVLDSDDFGAVATKLQCGKIICQDFEKTLALANKGDFVFIDPPYTVKHNLNGFLKYNEKIFSWGDQERLKDAIIAAIGRGVMITMTNADHDSIKKLYAGIGKTEKLARYSVIAGDATYRDTTSELLIRFGW